MKRDHAFIREQLSLYNPDVVILCGSVIGDGLEDLYSISHNDWSRTKRGIWYCEVNGALHVLTYHPSVRNIFAHDKHYTLINALSEARLSFRRN